MDESVDKFIESLRCNSHLFSIFHLSSMRLPCSIYLVIGSLLYIVGTIRPTIAFNVPLNDALAKVAPNSNEGVELWANYLSDWTFWNHVRTVAALVATAAFAIASLTASHIAP